MFRKLLLPVYIPIFLIQTGTAMLVPVLPLFLADQGLSNTLVGTIIAATGIGTVLSQVATGRLLERQSETMVMAGSIIVLSLSVLALGFLGAAVALTALRFISGIGTAGWMLSRQTYVTRNVNSDVRGRVSAAWGGTARSGFLLGPLLGGVVAEVYGFPAAFAVSASLSAFGLVPLLAAREPLFHTGTEVAARAATVHPSLRPHLKSLVVAGIGMVLVLSVRQGRLVVLPLVGADIGLSASKVGFLVAIGSFADLLLFPVSGFLMDRFGRLAAIVPSFGVVGLGLIMLALATNSAWVTVAAIVIGFGNGLGAGTLLTLASDLAPKDSPSRFLAALGTIRDSGRIAGPFLVGWIADLAGLDWSSAVLAGLAFLGIAVIVFGVGETKVSEVPPLRPA